MSPVPEIRVRRLNERTVNENGIFVVYWMVASRRAGFNFGLQRAVEWAERLKRPLVVFEPLRCDYPWASVRLHSFILQGMADNLAALETTPAFYYPFVERKKGEGRGLLPALAESSALIVTDDWPGFFLPRMLDAAAKKVPCLLEAVDSNGLLPMSAADKVFTTAYSFRRFLQKTLPAHLGDMPEKDPLSRADIPRLSKLPGELAKRWPPAGADLLGARPEALTGLPIDHKTAAVEMRGGRDAALDVLDVFLERKLAGYAELRNHPDEDAASGLSPYLHFGHISAAEAFLRVAQNEEWSFARLSLEAKGKREGFWGMREGAEAFLDQLVTWRELGFNMCSKTDDYGTFDSLPAWAKDTLGAHRRDPRDYVYSLREFEEARTHDDLWNAAQRELLTEGRLQNYLRMLWGKKILEWTPTPEDAIAIMIELNNRYALDGRDPNSYSGIFWVLGRYDRAFGPERPVFGKVRYMSSKNTLRKLRLEEYLETYGPRA